MTTTSADRRQWMRQTIASAELEGITFDTPHLTLCERVAIGELSANDFVDTVISANPHKQTTGATTEN